MSEDITLQEWYGQQMYRLLGEAIKSNSENDNNISITEMAKILAERKSNIAQLQLLKNLQTTFKLKPYRPEDWTLNCPVCKKKISEDC